MGWRFVERSGPEGMVMVMVKCSALVRSHLIYLAVGSFGPVPSRVDRLHPLRPCLYM